MEKEQIPYGILNKMRLLHNQARVLRVIHVVILITAIFSSAIFVLYIIFYSIIVLWSAVITFVSIIFLLILDLGKRSKKINYASELLDTALLKYQTEDGFTTKELIDVYEKSVLYNINEVLVKAQADKRSFTEKLEVATGDDVFKYLLLINTSALEGYIAQTRLQAEQSFQLSKIVAIVGFGLIAVGIGLGIYSSLSGKGGLEGAYLASITGLLTEFISGVLFYLYNKTLQQLNLFHDKMMSYQYASMSFLANSLVANETKRDEYKGELSKMLMSTAVKKE